MDTNDVRFLRATSRATRRVVKEVDRLLEHDRCAFLPKVSTMHIVYSGAGLSHGCRLLEALVSSARSDDDVSARLLARSHYESWLIATYILYGGMEALDHVAGAYKKAVRTMHRELNMWNERMEKLKGKIERKNRRIREANKRIEARNAVSETKRSLKKELPKPTHEPVDFDVSRSPAYNLDVEESDLNYLDVARKLGRLVSSSEDPYAEFESNYHLIYRGLSTLGAHPTLWVLDEYIRWPRRFVRIATELSATRMASAASHAALLMTARLSSEFFSRRDLETPHADRVLQRALAAHRNAAADP